MEGAGFGFVDEVLAEVNVGRVLRIAAEGGEGAERFGAVAFAGELIGGGDRAAGAGAGGAEGNVADAEARPGVFGEGFAAGEDEIGAKAVHGDGLGAAGDEAVVELGERGFADDEEGIAVGEGEQVVADEAVFDACGVGGGGRGSEGGFVEDGAAEVWADADEADRRLEERREPGGGFGAAVVGEEIFAAPDGNGDVGGRVVGGRFAWDRDRAVAVGGEREGVGGEGGGDLRHARERALGEELAEGVDDEEAAVADEAEGVDFGGIDGDAAEGFDGVDEQGGEVHGGEKLHAPRAKLQRKSKV